MLDLLEGLEEQPDKKDMRYVLSLLLVRRRVLRVEETERGEGDVEVTVLYCARRETAYRVETTMPSDERIAEIQQELAHLLFADAG
jgi:uncharacterized protein YbaR (Trm112 family)